VEGHVWGVWSRSGAWGGKGGLRKERRFGLLYRKIGRSVKWVNKSEKEIVDFKGFSLPRNNVMVIVTWGGEKETEEG